MVVAEGVRSKEIDRAQLRHLMRQHGMQPSGMRRPG